MLVYENTAKQKKTGKKEKRKKEGKKRENSAIKKSCTQFFCKNTPSLVLSATPKGIENIRKNKKRKRKKPRVRERANELSQT